ncbi:DUF2834 domain-containing protein [Rhodovulum sp. DZ06]|uniref:DUF2834 domain-containing protein n=1 Tax=Rhodovulum sp. DZ06 TaxID=3425126 RepID=UPI003D33F7D5
MSALRLTFLGLAVLGAAAPMAHLLPFLAENGWSIPAMIDGWTANGAATGLAWDLVIAALALTAWILAECRARDDRLALLAIPATFLVGVSFGLPLYLFLRTRPMERR